MPKTEKRASRKQHAQRLILLEDLALRKPVSGGIGGRLFGERGDRSEGDQPTLNGNETSQSHE